MKKGKMHGPDNIMMEEIETLGDFEIEVIKKLLNDIITALSYDS